MDHNRAGGDFIIQEKKSPLDPDLALQEISELWEFVLLWALLDPQSQTPSLAPQLLGSEEDAFLQGP